MLQQPFQGEFLLGTDQTGQSIAAGLVHSTPPILKMMASGAVFSTVMAVIWGVVAGYKGGTWDRVMMTVADIVMTIPGLPLIVVLATIWRPGNPYLVGILLSITGWAGLSRALRSQVLTLREESYVEASRILGMRNRTIMFKDILPNLMPYIMVNFVKSARGVIFAAVGLYFLGILPFTSLNWGVMMNLAYKQGALFNPNIAHWFIIPTLTVVVLSLGLILFGQGMDRLFNPRIRARHAKHTPDDEEEF
jgi:peptide/nickel transport system permease protein